MPVRALPARRLPILRPPPKPKWIELKGYCVTCTSQEDIRPPKEGEPKQKMTPSELVLLRGLLKDLGDRKSVV